MRYEVDEIKMKEGIHEMMKDKINRLDNLAKDHVQPDDKEFTKVILSNLTKEFKKYRIIASGYIKTEEYEKNFQKMIEEYKK